MTHIVRLLVAAFFLAPRPAGAATVSFQRNPVDTAYPAATYPNVRHPVDVHAADVDGDTDLDLVVSVTHLAGTGDGVYWYVNDGTLSFTKILIDTMLAGSDVDPVRMDVADVDDDLDVDIVLAGNDHLYLYTNVGAGSFTRSTIDNTTGALRIPVVADLDGDTDEDVALLANSGVYWLANDGSESFTRFTIDANPVVDLALAVADLDGDTDADVVASTLDVPSGNRYFAWYENLGGGSFFRRIFDVMDGTEDIADAFVADVNDDGRLDIAVAKRTDDSIWIYENLGGQVFTVRVVTTGFESPRRVWVTDLDNDTDEDVVAVGGTGPFAPVAYWENDGTETFTFRAIDATAGSRQGLFVVDADQNSVDDLFVTSASPAELVWLASPGTGTGVGDAPSPSRVRVVANVPNPFHPTTTIGFEVFPAGMVEVEIYTAAGVKLRTLARGAVAAGYHEVRWDGRDERGVGVASGVYFARVTAHGVHATRKMMLVM